MQSQYHKSGGLGHPTGKTETDSQEQPELAVPSSAHVPANVVQMCRGNIFTPPGTAKHWHRARPQYTWGQTGEQDAGY